MYFTNFEQTTIGNNTKCLLTLQIIDLWSHYEKEWMARRTCTIKLNQNRDSLGLIGDMNIALAKGSNRRYIRFTNTKKKQRKKHSCVVRKLNLLKMC